MNLDLLRKTTLKEVAALAGVSVATVDRVISNRANVSPHTRERVLAAIDTLNRGATADVATVSERRYAFVVESGAMFVDSIARTVEAVRDLYAALNTSLTVESVVDFEMATFLTSLRNAAASHDGVILLCREDPAIAACVNQLIEDGTSVVCFTSDLSDCARLAYVGANHVSAGRTAGLLMGRYIGPQAGDVVLVVSAPYRSQYERELGFRRIIREQFPNLRIHESLNNHDRDDDSYESLRALFDRGIKPLGIYNVTGGTGGVARAIEEKGWRDEIVFIGHELDASSGALLSNNAVDIIIDQDLRQEVSTAVNVLLHHDGVLKQAPAVTPTAPIITTRENIGLRQAPRDAAAAEWMLLDR